MTQVVFCKYAIQAYLRKREPNKEEQREWRNIHIYNNKEEAVQIYTIECKIVKNNPTKEYNQIRLVKFTNTLEILND